MSSVLPWVSFVLFYFTFFFFFGAIPKMKLNVLVCRLTVNFSFRDMFTGHYKKKKIGVLRRLNMPSREKKDENYIGVEKEVKKDCYGL